MHLGEISMLTLASVLVLGQVDVYYFCSNNKQRAGNVTRSCQSGSSSVTYCTLVYKTVTFWLVIHALKLWITEPWDPDWQLRVYERSEYDTGSFSCHCVFCLTSEILWSKVGALREGVVWEYWDCLFWWYSIEVDLLVDWSVGWLADGLVGWLVG